MSPTKIVMNRRQSRRSVCHRVDASHSRRPVVLGSGLSDYATSLDGAIEVPIQPPFPTFRLPKVAGSCRKPLLGSRSRAEAALLLFAGQSARLRGMGSHRRRLRGSHGSRFLDATGRRSHQRGRRYRTRILGPGDLVAIRDHLNLTSGSTPSAATTTRGSGPRFPDLTDASDRRTRELIGAHRGSSGRQRRVP